MVESKCFVITCNDSVEHVVIGGEDQAGKLMQHLATKYYERNFKHAESRVDYDRRVNWTTRPTPYVIGKDLVLHVTGDGS